jgi:excisionase family DNA binding protein
MVIQRDDLILTSEASRILGVSASTLRLWEKKGVIACIRTGKGVRIFNRGDIEALRRHRAEQFEGVTDAIADALVIDYLDGIPVKLSKL